jgi:hypothetical protein
MADLILLKDSSYLIFSLILKPIGLISQLGITDYRQEATKIQNLSLLYCQTFIEITLKFVFYSAFPQIFLLVCYKFKSRIC